MKKVFDYLDSLIPDYKCELIYNNDFEFLIAVVLSAQTTDKKVNNVTKVLFKKYDINSLSTAEIKDIVNILKPLGMANKKAIYIKNIANSIINNNYLVPNTREELVKYSGVGRKTANLVLSTLYNKSYFAVDTHIFRVCKRLGITNNDDTILTTEQKLCELIPNENKLKLHHQLVLFGRYYCKSINPLCSNCGLKDICKKTE